MCDVAALAEPEGHVTSYHTFLIDVAVLGEPEGHVTCYHTLLCDVAALAEPESHVTCYYTLLCYVAALAEPEGHVLGLVQPLAVHLLQQAQVLSQEVVGGKLVHVEWLKRERSV